MCGSQNLKSYPLPPPLLSLQRCDSRMTTPPKPTPLAPLPPRPLPPQNITSAIFQPVVQPAPSRPPLSGTTSGRDPTKLPSSCKPQEGPGRPLVWLVISIKPSIDCRLPVRQGYLGRISFKRRCQREIRWLHWQEVSLSYEHKNYRIHPLRSYGLMNDV